MVSASRGDSIVVLTSEELTAAGLRQAVVDVCVAAHDMDEFRFLFDYLPSDARHVLAFDGDTLVSHAVVGALVRRTLAGEAPLRELVAAHPVLGPDAAALVAPGVAVRRRVTPGGAGPVPVAVQLGRFRAKVAALRAAVADDVR